MSCKTCDFFKEASRNSLFWVDITRLNEGKMETRFLGRGEVNYCPTCGIELKTLREGTDETD